MKTCVFIAIVIVGLSGNRFSDQKGCYLSSKTREKNVCRSRMIELSTEMARVAEVDRGNFVGWRGKVTRSALITHVFTRVPSRLIAVNLSTLCRRNLKTEISPWKRIKWFPSKQRWRNLKTQQSPVILELCLTQIWSRRSHHYRDIIVFEKLRWCFQSVHTKTKSQSFQIPQVWRAFSNSSVFVTDQCGGRPNCRNKAACVFQFHRRSVDSARMSWALDISENCNVRFPLKISMISVILFKMGKQSDYHLSFFQIVGAWRDFAVVTNLII